MWTRRESVFGGALTLLFGTGLSCACQARPGGHTPQEGCLLGEKASNDLFKRATQGSTRSGGGGRGDQIIQRSGDRDFDVALAQSLSMMTDILDAAPGFAFYDDAEGLNAYATNRVRLNGTDGTVLFGQRLLKRLMSAREHPEISVAAVCAHEFGHILQFKRNLTEVVGAGQPTVKRVELQADFFGGFFAGKRKLAKPDFPAAVFALTQWNFGDNMLESPNHHGTARERAAATVAGFEAGFRDRRTLADAINVSINYVRTT